MSKLRYYWFAIRWLYRNQSRENTRQKYRALAREYAIYEREKNQQGATR